VIKHTSGPVWQCPKHERAADGTYAACPDCEIELDIAKTIEARARTLIAHVTRVLDMMGQDTVPMRKDISGALIEMAGAALRLEIAMIVARGATK
jgi:hypothetical protein